MAGEGPSNIRFVGCIAALQCSNLMGHQPLHFDTTSTLGFEGEGPEPWALASFNVGSLETHSYIFENILPMYLLSKELVTRHTPANRKKLQHDATSHDFSLHLGTDMAFRDSEI